MGMPSRHISPQSFDDILSELGDDPAIPDPHGIRKPNAPQSPHLDNHDHSKSQPKSGLLQQTVAIPELKKLAIVIGICLGLVGLGLALFVANERLNSNQETKFEISDKEITHLKKEISLLREEILEIEKNLYESMDLIEVSIYSLKQNKPSRALKQRPQAPPFESELSGWRYLGLSQIGSAQKAFFHNGKVTLMFETDSLLLGDWKLASANKELATLTHPQGKSLTLKTAKTE